MIRNVILFASIIYSGVALAEPLEHATTCASCNTPYEFAVHGVSALEVKQASKTIFEKFGFIKPITVHNLLSGKSAKVTVGNDYNSISLGFISIGVPVIGRVHVEAEMTDGSGYVAAPVSVDLIKRTIQQKNIKVSDIVNCPRSMCRSPSSVRGAGAVSSNNHWRNSAGVDFANRIETGRYFTVVFGGGCYRTCGGGSLSNWDWRNSH